MKRVRIIAGVVVALIGMVTSAQAAVTINSNVPGFAFNVSYLGLVGGVSTSNVTAAAAFNFTGTSNSGRTYNFNYSLVNNSIYNSRLSSFAFDTNPNISSVSSTGAFAFSDQNANYPEGIGNVEVCFTEVSNGSCTGNGAGLTANPDQTGTGSFALTFAQAMSSVDLSDFAVRFQAIDPTVGGSSSGVGIGTIVSAAPEPMTWAMMIGGFGLIGMALRRRATTPIVARRLAI